MNLMAQMSVEKVGMGNNNSTCAAMNNGPDGGTHQLALIVRYG